MPVSVLNAQDTDDCTHQQTFIKLYGDDGSDELGWKFLRVPDEGFYQSTSIDDKVAISYFSDNGNLIWTETSEPIIGGIKESHSLEFDSDGNLLSGGIAPDIGQVTGPITTSYVFKFNPSTQSFDWIKSLTTEQIYLSNIIELTPGGDLGVFSLIITYNTLGCDAGFFKLDRNTGNLVSSNFLNLGSCESYIGVKLHQGSIYTCGRYNSTASQSTMRAAVSKLDLDGNEIWSSIYLNAFNQTARQYNTELLIMNDQTITISGRGDPNGTSLDDIFIHTYNVDLDGNINWASYVDISGVQVERTRFSTLLDDGYLVGGHYGGNPNRQNFVIKFNLNGQVQWAKHYDVGVDSSIEDAIAVGENIYFSGYASIEGNDQQILLIKTNSEGEVLSDCTINDLNIIENSIDNPYKGQAFINQSIDDQPFDTQNNASMDYELEENISCLEECTCEEDISGGVISSDPLCDLSGINIIITAADGTTTTVSTDADGNFIVPNGPYPCGTYIAEFEDPSLLPSCYTDTGSTDPITFDVDGDTTTDDGPYFIAGPTIPTLSQWGLITLAILLMTFGALSLSNIRNHRLIKITHKGILEK